jgi:hypothetical protein
VNDVGRTHGVADAAAGAFLDLDMLDHCFGVDATPDRGRTFVRWFERGGVVAYAALAFASWIAAQIRCGVAGMSMCVMP